MDVVGRITNVREKHTFASARSSTLGLSLRIREPHLDRSF